MGEALIAVAIATCLVAIGWEAIRHLPTEEQELVSRWEKSAVMWDDPWYDPTWEEEEK